MLATSRRCGVGVKTHILWKVRVLLAGKECCHYTCMLPMKLTPQLRLRLSPFAAMAITGLIFTAQSIESQLAAQTPDQVSAAAAAESPEPIDALFKQLDSPSFKDREAATEELIELGPEILKPLTVHFFNSSSEAGWRIHRILEGIGKSGNEEDFLKSVAIIQLLYGAQDPQSQERLAGLQFRWMAARRTEAARKLGKLGFKLSAQLAQQTREAALERALVEKMLMDFERVERGGIRIATSAPVETSEPKKPAVTPWVNPRLDRRKSIQQAEEIINGDADENRAIVESVLSPSMKASLPPATLKFPKDWKANEESLKLIDDLSPLSGLTFQNQNIGSKLQKFISQQNRLTTLELIDCKFEEGSRKHSFPASVSRLHLEGSLPFPSSFRSIVQLSSLKLSKVKLDNDVAYAISKRKVQTIELEEVEFTRISIKRLVSMRGLFRVSMSLCKFDLEWLEDIRSKNPNIIEAKPTAFLGVQGPVPRSPAQGAGCQITQVVEETAAANAGMKAMDIVTAMDGTKIKRFEDLRLMISQKRPGETMELEVQRGDETIELNVQLGEYK